MGKIIETRQLYKEVINEISQSAENWIKFLDSSAWNFKYDFDDQILIYAQRPNAKACATMQEWNEKVVPHRWVNNNSKPIYIFEKNPYSKYPFKLVFDLADTNNYNNTEYKLWTIKQNYEENIIESLEINFGEISSKENLSQAIIFASYNMVVDNIEDYFTSILKNKKNSMLETISDEEIKNMLITITWMSVSYMIMTRCGINAKKQIQEQELSYIKYFNNQEVLTTLGACVSDIAEMGLREIARTVSNLQKREKLKNRTIEKFDKQKYSNDNEKIKGGNEDGRENRVHETRGLLHAQSSNEEREDTNRKIRSDEIQLSEKSQELRVDNISNEQEANTTFDTNRETNEPESKKISRDNEETTRNNRGIEIQRPNDMGRTYEQYQSDSRGDGSKRDDLYLDIYSKDSSRDCPYVVTDSKINQILANAPHLRVSNSEIKEQFEKEKDKNKRAEFLKNSFNIDYTEITINDERYGYKAFENGLLVWKGSFFSRDTESFILWEDLIDNYEAMIMLNQLKDVGTRIPSVTDQMSLINSTEKKQELEFTQEFIDRVLQGRGFSKYSIYQQFEKKLSLKDNADYLKRMYGLSYYGVSDTIPGAGIGLQCSPKGMTLNRGYFKDEIKFTISWNNVAKRITELIRLERYLNENEIVEYPNWLKEKELQEVRENQEEQKEYELEKRVPHYEYQLGDTVYIGADKYEIAGIKDNIVNLIDAKFPILHKQMNLDEFEKKIRNSYANDHLIVKEQEENTVEASIEQTSEQETQKEAIQAENEQQIENERNFPKQDIKPNFVRAKNKIQDFVLHPEVALEDRNNYKITDNNLGVGTPREKFERNIVAIQVLKKCEKEDRYATPQEMKNMSKYVGWGGLQEAFKEDDSSWSNENKILKKLLNEEEYKNARSSVLTAFYTPPIVINSMYEILQNMGLKEANILEPSCGVGNFFGMLPTELEKKCKMYGVELDSISGRITQQLYQKSTIAVNAYEKVELPDSFFDVAVR